VGEERKVKRRREKRRKEKTNWGSKRKMEQERAEQTEISIEWKKEIGNNK
jgi:hypothetical protein